MWEDLPEDLIHLILYWHNKCLEKSALTIQKCWTAYKVRSILKIFKELRYLQEFRFWNPSFNTYSLKCSTHEQWIKDVLKLF